MTLVLLALLVTCCLLCARGQGLRDAAVRGPLLLGAAVIAVTGILSPFHLLRRWPVFLAWLLLLAAAAWRVRRAKLPYQKLSQTRIPLLSADALLLAGIAAISGVTLVTALISAPNTVDALAYHLPRVLYWAQQSSVAFFPTSYFNQISMPPLAEYINLHSYLLAGSDRFANLPQWLGLFGATVGVSLIAKLYGAGMRGQIGAALFCATLPNGILQASGAKNDYLLAFWLVAMCYCAIRYKQHAGRADLLGLAVALALATKSTAYLYAPPLLAAILLPQPKAALRAAPFLLAAVLLFNGPQYWRNYRFSGSPLGYDSAQGDGFFRWRNETFGWKQTVSNLLRNTSEQLGARSPEWNSRIYNAVLRAHQRLGIDPSDPATTWRWTVFEPPRNTNHEANANNRWHLAFLLLAAAFISWRKREWLLYTLAILAGFLFFCFYLKWQLYLSRMFLPLFVLSAPIFALAIEQLRPAWLRVVICVFLLNNARPYLFENWVRPWRGPNSIFKTSRDSQYFNDMGQWGNRDSFERSVAIVSGLACDNVGIDISHFHVEYPFQALLRERKPTVRFVHSDVTNGGSCAVLCMDCAGDQSRIDRYAALGPPIQIGRFLLFAPRP